MMRFNKRLTLVWLGALLFGCTGATEMPSRAVTLHVPLSARQQFLVEIENYAAAHHFNLKKVQPLEAKPNSITLVMKRFDIEIDIANDAYSNTNPFAYQIFFYNLNGSSENSSVLTSLSDDLIARATRVAGVQVLDAHRANPDAMPIASR